MSSFSFEYFGIMVFCSGTYMPNVRQGSHKRRESKQKAEYQEEHEYVGTGTFSDGMVERPSATGRLLEEGGGGFGQAPRSRGA